MAESALLNVNLNEIKILVNDKNKEQFEDDGDQTSQHINPLFNDYYGDVCTQLEDLKETKLLVFPQNSPPPSPLLNNSFCLKQNVLIHKPIRAKIVNNHLIGSLLGDGSYGKVKECLDLYNLSRRAVKIINLKTIAKKIPHGVENVQKEINIMKRLNNKNLIKLYDYYEKSSTKLYIFMDYCMTSLEKLVKNAHEQKLCNWQAQHYFKQLIDGLEYLHSINIIHNDIKPGNLLIACDDLLKICDFSVSAEFSIFYEQEYAMAKKNPNIKTRFPIAHCTPLFQCPEMLDEQIDELNVLKHAHKIDVWATGVTLYQVTSGELPFKGETMHKIYENIRTGSINLDSKTFPDKNLVHLLSNMLHRKPCARWSLKQIRDCEWFRRKHPLVKEELALLNEDVIENEFKSFKMLDYLEKVCEQQDQFQMLLTEMNSPETAQNMTKCCFDSNSWLIRAKNVNSFKQFKTRHPHCLLM